MILSLYSVYYIQFVSGGQLGLIAGAVLPTVAANSLSSTAEPCGSMAKKRKILKYSNTQILKY